jgi:hypothetical protein
METNADHQKPIPGSAQPATIGIKVHLPQASIAIRPNLWHNWARLAMRSEARAVAAFRRGEGASDIAPYVEAMTMETMIAVTAVRSSFHHLYVDWHAFLGLRPEGDERKVPERATTDVPTDPDEHKAWLGAIRKVVEDRDMIIHEAQDSHQAVAHPLGGNTSPLDAYFVSDRATEVVDVMLDFYRRVIASPTPSLQDWANKRAHVPQQLEEFRQRYKEAESSG